MKKVRVVTDSTAVFEEPHFAEDYFVSVAPLSIQFGNKLYEDGKEITAEDMFMRLRHTDDFPTAVAPSVEIFESIYQELNAETDQICVVVSSQHLTASYEHAQTARGSLLGRCDIVVLDSMTTSLGLGFLTQVVAKAADEGASLDEIVRIARGVIPRLYSVYYVESLSHIQRAGLIGETQAILGHMLGIKPLLTIEDGELITMEKARTHSQAIDKMVEFTAEFTQIEKIGILQNSLRTTDRTRMLQDRLALEIARYDFPVMLYGPLLATIVGPDAMGVVILEGEDELS